MEDTWSTGATWARWASWTSSSPQGLTSLEPEVAQLVHGPGAALPNMPVFTTTSPDNPLLDITAQEYLTLQRFAKERTLPPRFKELPGNSTAHANTLYQAKDATSSNPTFKTSYK